MIPGITAGGAARWSPRVLNPYIWLDDSSPMTIVSGACSYWDDLSGQGHGFDQGTAGLRPQVLSAELAGRRVLRFDGVDDRMNALLPQLMRNVAAGSVFGVYRRRATTLGYRRLFSVVHDYPSSGYSRFGTFVSDAAAADTSPWFQSEGVGGGGQVDLFSTSPPSVTDWGLHFLQRDFAGGVAEIVSNGVTTASAAGLPTGNTTDINNTQPVYIAANFTGGQIADIDLACLIVFSGSAIDEDGRQKLEGWAAWRYGLQGNLPSGHPYKDAPP